MQIILAIFIFSFIVFFHELGHFLLAKASKINVLEFSIGMGPRLFSFTRGGTRYSWKLLPFGGSCAMQGEDEDCTDEGSFQSAPAWKRILVVAAGPAFNFLLAFLLACIIIGISGYDRAVVSSVEEASPAMKAGLQKGDQILAYEGNGIANMRELLVDMRIDGIPSDQITLTYLRDKKKYRIRYKPQTEIVWQFGYFKAEDENGIHVMQVLPGSPFQKAGLREGDDILEINGIKLAGSSAYEQYLSDHPLDGSAVTFLVERNQKQFEVSVTPQKNTVARLGFEVGADVLHPSFFGILRAGGGEIEYWVHVTLKSLAGLVRGVFSIKDISGPVGVIQVIDTAYEEAKSFGLLPIILTMMNMAVLLSANLGVMNLLPVPALDGGRLVFLVIEAVRRKPLNRKIEGYVHFAGFLLLMGLMVLVCLNDIQKLIF